MFFSVSASVIIYAIWASQRLCVFRIVKPRLASIPLWSNFWSCGFGWGSKASGSVRVFLFGMNETSEQPVSLSESFHASLCFLSPSLFFSDVLKKWNRPVSTILWRTWHVYPGEFGCHCLVEKYKTRWQRIRMFMYESLTNGLVITLYNFSCRNLNPRL